MNSAIKSDDFFARIQLHVVFNKIIFSSLEKMWTYIVYSCHSNHKCVTNCCVSKSISVARKKIHYKLKAQNKSYKISKTLRRNTELAKKYLYSIPIKLLLT